MAAAVLPEESRIKLSRACELHLHVADVSHSCLSVRASRILKVAWRAIWYVVSDFTLSGAHTSSQKWKACCALQKTSQGIVVRAFAHTRDNSTMCCNFHM